MQPPKQQSLILSLSLSLSLSLVGKHSVRCIPTLRLLLLQDEKKVELYSSKGKADINHQEFFFPAAPAPMSLTPTPP
jgi:hypothetical protein